MPRQRAVLAAIFAIVVVAAASLLYRADRERVRAIAERSAQTTEAPAVVTPQKEPATDSASSASAPPAEQPVVPSTEPGTETAEQIPAADKPATVEASASGADAPQSTTAAPEPELAMPTPASDQEGPAPANGEAAQRPKETATADIQPEPPATSPPSETPNSTPPAAVATPAAPTAPTSDTAVAEDQSRPPPVVAAAEPDATTAPGPEASPAGTSTTVETVTAAPQTSDEVETEAALDEADAASPTAAPMPGEQTEASAAATLSVPSEPAAAVPPAQMPDVIAPSGTPSVEAEVQPLAEESAGETKAPAAELPDSGEIDPGTEIAEPAGGTLPSETPGAVSSDAAPTAESEPSALEQDSVADAPAPVQKPAGADVSENEVAAVAPSARPGPPASDGTAPAIQAAPDVVGQIPVETRPTILLPAEPGEPELPVASREETMAPEVAGQLAGEARAAEPIEPEEAGIAPPEAGEAEPLTPATAEEQDQRDLAVAAPAAEPITPAIGQTTPEDEPPLSSDADRAPAQDLAATEPPPLSPQAPPSASSAAEQPTPDASATTSAPAADAPPAEPVEIAGATAEAHAIGDMQVASALQVITPPVEIARAETGGASLPSSSASATATIAAVELSDIVGSAVDNQTRSAAAVSEAPSGILEVDRVTIRAAEAEANTLYVAGAAAPGTAIKVYADNNLVGEATTSDRGVWLVEAQKEVSVGEVNIRAEVVSEIDVASAPVAEASVPFMRFPDGIVLQPIVTATVSEGSLRSESTTMLTPSYVIIRRGDNLWRIARRNYGRGIKYKAIFAANQDLIEDPHWIFPGQVFVVPTRDLSWERAVE